MRRTRYVVLPVRSWQYIGFMVVSLACLTLGLVSRDREGKCGSLTSPELKHPALHEVDACPNDNLFTIRTRKIDETRFQRMNSNKQSLNRQTTAVQTAEAAVENVRLNRLYVSRSSGRRDMRTRIDERRSVSLDRRRANDFSLDNLRNRQIIERTRSLDRRAGQPIDNNSYNINARRIRVQRLFLSDHKERSNIRESNIRYDNLRSQRNLLMSERRNRITNENRNQIRIDVRRESGRVDERKLLDRRMERHVKVQDTRRDKQFRSNNRFNERVSDERREIRGVEMLGTWLRNSKIDEVDSMRRNIQMIRVSADFKRQLSKDRRNSIINEQSSRFVNQADNRRFNSEHRIAYITTATEFPLVKSTVGTEGYEFLRQILILTLCTVYTISLFKRKSGFFGNILPQINRLTVY